MFFAQAQPPSFWNAPNGSSELWIKIIVTLLLGIGAIFALMQMPTRGRRPVVAGLTFIAGLYYILLFVWPTPIDKKPGDVPRGAIEGVGFWIQDAVAPFSDFTNILSAFMLGLGIYSLLRIHGKKLFKFQKDWQFSLVLIVSLVLMVYFGYADWRARFGENGPLLDDRLAWGNTQYARHFLFEGLLQTMDAAMFSLIAFYILSAAYRAFRVRSIEATILLATALIVMLSLMGAVEYKWNQVIDTLPGAADGTGIAANFRLTEISKWLRDTFQTPSIRGIDFGVGIGALAMGLRLWLSLEKSGTVNS